MQPNNPRNNPQTSYPRQSGPVSRAPANSSSQQASANITRSQIQNIYSSDPTHNMTMPSGANPTETKLTPNATQPEIESTSVYSRTLTSLPNTGPDQNDWKNYHTSWQNYYQQYFYRYYANTVQQSQKQVAQSQQTIEAQSTRLKELENRVNEITPEAALTDLRSKLRRAVREKSKMIQKNRHFKPVLAALSVMFVFAVLQYNSVAFAAYYSYIAPAVNDPINVIVDPTEDIDVGPDPRLIIPKLSVDVPIIWDTTPKYDSQMAAMEKGVAWFGIPGANSKPGQVGNTVLSGHSSNDWIETGNYKFIFARLDKLNNGDVFYINYEHKRYTYTVTKKEIVTPQNVGALIYKTNKPVVTLITCTPLGTADKRLLVTAEQISPNIDNATPPPVSSSESTKAEMPGKGSTLLEKLFGN